MESEPGQGRDRTVAEAAPVAFSKAKAGLLGWRDLGCGFLAGKEGAFSGSDLHTYILGIHCTSPWGLNSVAYAHPGGWLYFTFVFWRQRLI